MHSVLSSQRKAFAERFRVGRVGMQAMWIVAPFALQQVLRLATNIVLARLLAPEMFGLMLLVNTLRTGAELLSDIGIGQSVVRSPHGNDRAFLDVAWTLQLARGAILAALTACAAVPLATVYHNPQVTPIIAMVSTVFVFTGLQSPGLFLLQRNMELRRRALYDVACTVFQCVFTIALAAIMPSVWALAWGLIAGTAFSMVMSYGVGIAPLPRLSLQRHFVHDILHFGKWIFLATAVYFAATNADKLYFTAALPLALAGVYGVARTFADMLGLLAQRAGAFLVFPKVAALRDRRDAATAHLRRKRFAILAVLALALAVAVGGSDRFVLLCYDRRYLVAAFLLPVLLAGTWFSVLATFAEATLLGCDRPAPAALGNGAKFLVLLVGLPLALRFGDFADSLLILIAAEAVRWLMLAFALQKERLATVADDVILTVLFATSALSAKVLLGLVGLTPSLAAWWAIGTPIHG